MTWTSKIKDLSPQLDAHPTSAVGLIGRAPGFATINFGPLDLYGAAARCSHLGSVNPVLVTPESQMTGALVEQYVDDVSADFAILPTTAHFKDFVKSYFAGTVASGLAYLAMIDDGYIWSDHFENVGGGNTDVAKSPDFVFAGLTTGLALVESKGTRSARLSAFDSTVDAGYVDQVEPHLGYTVGGATATHGYCIGAWLTSTSKAELLAHHTAVTAITGQEARAAAPLAAVQRQNCATAFSLAHSVLLGEQLRGVDEGRYDVPFARIEWGGTTWLTGLTSPRWSWWWWDGEMPFANYPASSWPYFLADEPPPFFAVEERVAKVVLGRFLAFEPATDDDLPIEPLPRDFRVFGSRGEDPQSGAVFPALRAMIAEREEEKVRLEAHGSAVNNGKSTAILLPHPVLVEQFRAKIASLHQALDDVSIRAEAAAVLSTLIESVTIYPDEPDGPEAEVVAKVADLLVWATNDNAAPKGGVCSSITVVAGTGFGRCRTRFRVTDSAVINSQDAKNDH